MSKQGMSGLGVVLLLLGGCGFFWAGPRMDVVRSGLGQFAAALSSQTANEMQMWQAVYYGGILAMVLVIVLLQLWLITATMEAYLGGDDSIVLPAALASLACLALNLGLFRYLRQLEF